MIVDRIYTPDWRRSPTSSPTKRQASPPSSILGATSRPISSGPPCATCALKPSSRRTSMPTSSVARVSWRRPRRHHLHQSPRRAGVPSSSSRRRR